MKKMTRTTRVYNPDLGDYEWKEVETDRYVFDETDNTAMNVFANAVVQQRCIPFITN